MPTPFVNKERIDIGSSVPGDTPLLWQVRAVGAMAHVADNATGANPIRAAEATA